MMLRGQTTKLLLLDSLLSEVKPRQIFTMSVFESYWANKAACDDAERAYYEKLSGCKSAQAEAPAAKKEGGSASEEEPAKNPGAFKNAANGERTFIMCKPDAVQRGLVGEIMERFERRGLRLLCAKMMHAQDSLLKEHYADLSKKGFFSELIRYMGSGAVVPMVWQGLGAVKQGRVLLGATNPQGLGSWHHPRRPLHRCGQKYHPRVRLCRVRRKRDWVVVQPSRDHELEVCPNRVGL